MKVAEEPPRYPRKLRAWKAESCSESPSRIPEWVPRVNKQSSKSSTSVPPILRPHATWQITGLGLNPDGVWGQPEGRSWRHQACNVIVKDISIQHTRRSRRTPKTLGSSNQNLFAERGGLGAGMKFPYLPSLLLPESPPAPTGCCGIAFDLSEGDFQSTQCGWLHWLLKVWNTVKKNGLKNIKYLFFTFS